MDPIDTEALKAFAKTIVNDAGRFGTILTVDRIDGELRWWKGRTLRLKPSEREAVRQLARDLLEDIGQPGSDSDVAEGKSYQIIRKLTIEEERQIRRSQ